MEIIRISAIWCTSCIITNKDYNKIKEKYNNFKYTELDYDTDDIEKYNPGEILPIIIILKDGEEIGRVVGEKNYKEIENKLIELGC